ncbi:MAG: metallophosphoesterase [Akkermansiaceae bacterium]|nr:metallophosphoesterase [Akkermansiaceae bacterium]MCP5546675.1 metallophosphoesterase [Akkermansiaceae bacterium]
MSTRRRFLAGAGATAAGCCFALPVLAASGGRRLVRIGLIADVHKDIMPDADERLLAFIGAAETAKVDAIVQLGDFCVPKPENRGFLDIFHRFDGPRFHVLGNHDTDGGFTREQTMDFWGMERRFGSFDLGGFHFIHLDANDRPEGWKSGYPHFIAEVQVRWLRRDLAATRLPTFVFSHQSLERPGCIDNQEEIRSILEAGRLENGDRKVAGCFNGHWHIDHHRVIGGIPYVHINSASYFWLGAAWRHERLPPGLAKRFPHVSSTAPYTKPLFTILEIDPVKGRFTLRSAAAEWMGPSPAELGRPFAPGEEDFVKPAISALDLAIA